MKLAITILFILVIILAVALLVIRKEIVMLTTILTLVFMKACEHDGVIDLDVEELFKIYRHRDDFKQQLISGMNQLFNNWDEEDDEEE